MKHYFQIIKGKPTKKGTLKDVAIRRIEHGKPLSSMERKLVLFRAYVTKVTGQISIHNISDNNERSKVRIDALKYAGL